jgi:hypothetical protein
VNESQTTQRTADAFSSGAYRYQLQAGVLLQLHRASEAIAGVHKPLGTKIVQVEPLASAIVVREDYYKFPRGQSNLYLIDYVFQILWRAELPMPDDVFANPVLAYGDYFECASWNGITCRICRTTGRILSTVFTK